MLLVTRDDHAALKRFALMMMWAFPLFFSVIVPWLFGLRWQWWPLVVSALFGLLYVAAPGLIYYPYRGWMAVAGVIGWINTRLILGFTFYVLILPIGLVLRLFGRLQYFSRPKPGKSSYYVQRSESLQRDRLEHPF